MESGTEFKFDLWYGCLKVFCGPGYTEHVHISANIYKSEITVVLLKLYIK